MSDRHAVDRGQRVEHTTWTGQLTRGHGEPWNETNSLFSAVVEHALAVTIGRVVSVLYSGDLDCPSINRELFHGDFGKTNGANLSFAQQFTQQPELIVGGNGRVDSVQLKEFEFRHSAKYHEARGAVTRIALHAIAGNTHSAESKAVNGLASVGERWRRHAISPSREFHSIQHNAATTQWPHWETTFVIYLAGE